MATPFSDVYTAALLKFSESDLYNLDELDREDILFGYLKSAVADFMSVCYQDFTFDEEEPAFTVDLTLEEVEILALGMALKWLNNKLLYSDALANHLSTKDYVYNSPANLISSITSLRNRLMDEYNHKIIDYSYRYSDIDELRSTR